MNHQSDHGYTFGGIEHRTKELCLQRAALCEQLASQNPQDAKTYRGFAVTWRAEAEYYGGAECTA